MDEFSAPVDPRDRFRNLDALVQILLRTGEDPLVVAQAAKVSPHALVAALPRDYLARFVPNAQDYSVGELLLKLSQNHALDVAVESITDPYLETRTRVLMARDLLDRNSVVGQKTAPAPAKLSLSDDALKKLLELEQSFLGSPTGPDEIPPQFRDFHSVGGAHEKTQTGQDDETQGWAGPVPPVVRSLSFELDDHD